MQLIITKTLSVVCWVSYQKIYIETCRITRLTSECWKKKKHITKDL